MYMWEYVWTQLAQGTIQLWALALEVEHLYSSSLHINFKQ
jgi:hypothetical protein